jgi:hypothetical protein
MVDNLRRDKPALGQGIRSPEGQYTSLSAPGTESFKQDYARWESLRRDAVTALEQVEIALAQRIREKDAGDAKDHFRSGGDDRTPRAYQSLVDKYYQSLARRPRP